jgi:hypothetical protein
MTETLNPYTLSPLDVKPGIRAGYKVIAVCYGNGWMAYRGLTDWDDERVASEGDALDEKTARLLFYAFNNCKKPYADY